MFDGVSRPAPLEVWAGAECSVVRVGDAWVDQLVLTGHADRSGDIERLVGLGARAIRYAALWERAPEWRRIDSDLEKLRRLDVRPIIGLVHHGSGPRGTSLLEDSFVDGLASFGRRVAERYRWITAYTPVNEPLTTARFSGLYGHWYPHERRDNAFVRALFVECLAIRATMRAIRSIVPGARLVQTEDLGTVFATKALAYQAEFENHRRFLSLDLLCGKVDAHHPLRGWLASVGASEAVLQSFVDDPCPPDVVGLNHYVTSDRFLDERIERYPEGLHGGNGRHAYADVEAVRVRTAGVPGHRALLHALWDRYRLPLAITEVHIACTPEEQVRWLVEAWDAARSARRAGVDVRAVTLWSAFGACDWDSLLTRRDGRYEAGAFEVRGSVVRPTLLAEVARDLATSGHSDHSATALPGWWRRPERLVYEPFAEEDAELGGDCSRADAGAAIVSPRRSA